MSPKLQVSGPRQNLGQCDSRTKIFNHSISVSTPEDMSSKEGYKNYITTWEMLLIK